MDTNPYAPPTAVVEDVEVNQSTPGTPLFFAVGRTKLIIMCVCTMSLYEIYWFYQNWKIIRARDRDDFSAAGRAIFAVFYIYKLFDRVRQQDPALPAASFSAGALAAGWIIFSILVRLPDPYWLVSEAAPLFFLPVQATINQLNREAAPQADPNTRLTGWNWVAVVLGALFWLLLLIAVFVVDK